MSLPGVLLCLLWPTLAVAAAVYLGRRFVRRMEALRDEAARAERDAYDHSEYARDLVDKFNADEAPTVVIRPLRPAEQPHRLAMTRGERLRAQGAGAVPKHRLKEER